MRQKTWILGALVVFLVLAGLSLAWVSTREGGNPFGSRVVLAQESSVQQAITDSGQAAVKQAIARVGPAVVRIDVTGVVDVTNPFSDFFNDPFFRRFFGEPSVPQQQERRALGSGVVIDYAGEKLVLTNAHVIDQAKTIRVTSVDGSTWDAEVVGSDSQLDVAILRLKGETKGLSTAPLGASSALEIGDWAIAIGNPLGLSYTVTMGIISATNRDIEKPTGVGQYENLIQTDAAINPGNSGGPLVNAKGEVVGINVAIARESNGVTIEGINFAVAIDGVKDILNQLVTTGKVTRGWLGVYIQDITPPMEEKFGVKAGTGVLVSDVVASSPAEQAGVHSGDVITKVDGEAVGSTDALIHKVSLLPVGTVVDLEIVRSKETLRLPVTLGERPSEEALYSSEKETAPAATQKFGLTVGPVTPNIAEQLGLQSTQGVVIMDVAAGSRAYWAGLEPNDVILEIDLRPVASAEDWNTMVAGMADDANPMFTILRNGTTRFVTLGR
jgi:serine protease Do